VALKSLLLAPGERADVIVDSSAKRIHGKTVILENDARAPYPNGVKADPRTVGRIMAFRVVRPLDTSVYPVTTLPADLRPLLGPVPPLSQTGATRRLLLFEGTDAFGRLRTQLGTAAQGALLWGDPVTENPGLHDVEVWELYNTTADAHPIHLHRVAFQIQNRQEFKALQDPDTGALSRIRLHAHSKRAEENERGWKDAVVAYPGDVTRIIVPFERAGESVWHCHILSHEDHEMMRPFFVGPMT